MHSTAQLFLNSAPYGRGSHANVRSRVVILHGNVTGIQEMRSIRCTLFRLFPYQQSSVV